MYPFGGVTVAPLVAGYLAALWCRLARHRGKRPGWFIAPVAAVLGLAAAIAATFQKDLFQPSHWSSKVEALDMLVLAGVPSAFTAAVAALSVLLIYRARHASAGL